MKKRRLVAFPVAFSVAFSGVIIALGCAFLTWHFSRSPGPDVPELNASLLAGGGVAERAVGEVSDDDGFDYRTYDRTQHPTLSRVLVKIREHYVDPERVQPYEMFLAALHNIQKVIPEVLVDDTEAPRQVSVAVGERQQIFRVGEIVDLWEVAMALRDIFRFLMASIDDVEVQRNIEYAAINGILSTLDPHSILLPPEIFAEFKMSTQGEFGGLGIVISIRDGALTVISPIVGTPASRAGLKAHDKIVKIGEESTVNMTLEEAVQRLRGRPQTKVAVWVMRSKWTEPRRFELTRAIIKFESVTSELLADSVGYVHIKSFRANTFDDLRTHLEGLRQRLGSELKGLVLDLRQNPGGLLEQAILVADRFVEKGALVITVGQADRRREVKSAHFAGTETAYPIVVLVNGGSASASEIVAGALKNHGRALVMGQQTFGKGSVQVVFDFKDKSALKLTIAQYLTPGDVSIQSVGIAPDIEIVPATVEKPAVHLFADDEGTREKDLEKHLARHGDNGAALNKPVARLVHLLPPGEGDDAALPEEEAAARDEISDDKFKSDFEIELATDFLKKAQGNDRGALLDASREVLAVRKSEQQAAIAGRFESFGLDWRSEPAGIFSPRLHAKLDMRLLEAGDKVSAPRPADLPFKAGETVRMVGQVTNVGDAAANRVYGVTESENPLFRGREFVFGRLAPRESREWTVDVKLPKDMSSRADPVTLKLGHEYGDLDGAEAATAVAIARLAEPRFGISYRVFDDDSSGNHDGVLQIGEDVTLEVTVDNRGPGAAEAALVTVKNLAGETVFLDKGRENIGALAVGAEARAELKFSLRQPSADRGEGEDEPASKIGDTVGLKIAVWDTELGVSVSEDLHLPVVEARALRNDRQRVAVGGESGAASVPVYTGAHESTQVLAHVAAGAVLAGDLVTEDGQWRRVKTDKGSQGFLRARDVAKLLPPKTVVHRARMELVPGNAPPAIVVDLPALLTKQASFRLTGELRDEGHIRDYFVFVNDKKVVYRGVPAGAPGQSGLRVPLDIALPLKSGANTVALIVRETDELMSRLVFGVFREASETTVAERFEGPPEVGFSQWP